MASPDAGVLLRLGTHAEKEYFEKLLRFFAGVIIGANLFESKPGATASLVAKKLLFQGDKQLPYIIDPMTYAFGTSINRDTGELRTDLDWLKSDQKRGDTYIRDYKSSYVGLSEKFGPLFGKALNDGRSLSARDLTPNAIREVAENVANYQTSCLRTIMEKDEWFDVGANELPRPAIIFSPYFLIDPRFTDFTLQHLHDLTNATVAASGDSTVFAVLCASKSCLSDRKFMDQAVDVITRTGAKGVAFWFSQFEEHSATTVELSNLMVFVEKISQKGLGLINLHGGYFSLVLQKVGLHFVSHGVGYGEVKDVVPVIGQATPTVQYYLPSIHRKVNALLLERAIAERRIQTPAQFHASVCDCAICRGVIVDSLSAFKQFGERHKATNDSKRLTQTPAAAKRCRFHYLINRVREVEQVKDNTIEQIAAALVRAQTEWSVRPIPPDLTAHLQTWRDALLQPVP